MKTVIGLIMMLGGVILGLYMGIWWAFIGGIVQVIQEIRAEDLHALNVAIGVAKIIFAAFIGWVSAAVLLLPGWIMIKLDNQT